ncbi:MAG: geobacillin-26 family protein [Bacillota bacterium]|jgi:uncharacterized membrane protein
MFKFSSRLVAVLMALFVLAATVLPGISFASSEGTQVLQDNKNKRIAINVTDGVVTKATFDKKSNTLKIEEKGKETVSIDLEEVSNKYVEENVISEDTTKSSDFGIMAATTKQNTWINYEYTITHSSPEKWQLRRPKGDSLVNYYYKNVTRTSSNASNLDKFQTAVENIDYYEWRAIGTSLSTVGLSWLAFILSVPTAGAGTLTAGLAALGAYGATADALLKLHKNANLASTYYHRV